MNTFLHATTPAPFLHQEAETTPVEHSLPRRAVHTLAVLALWLIVYGASLFTPPLLDDADATHAQAAAAMARTGDWVTLHVDGIRYLEKPPLPYWMVAIDDRLFGFNTFSTHLPLALAVLALALLARSWIRWASRDELAGTLAAVMTLTSVGMFLFTRIFIPDVLLALFLLLGLYAIVRAVEEHATARQSWIFAALLWTSLACAVLTKGLVAIVFLAFVGGVWLALTGRWRAWRRLHPFSGVLLFLAIAAPWHILAGIRNRGGANGHGFFWFYFINEHVLRFLGKRLPRDYNKVPWFLYWPMHLLWLFPWAALLPVAWTRRHTFAGEGANARRTRESVWMLAIFSAFVLIFFSLSTNQEYYTLPVYVPLLMLLALPLAEACRSRTGRAFGAGLSTLAALGLLAAGALVFGLWSARGLPGTADIGALLAHRGVGDYTLSTSHLFDLTGRSFAALRLPAALALIAFGVGLPMAWIVGVPGKRRLQFALVYSRRDSRVSAGGAHRPGPFLAAAVQ